MCEEDTERGLLSTSQQEHSHQKRSLLASCPQTSPSRTVSGKSVRQPKLRHGTSRRPHPARPASPDNLTQLRHTQSQGGSSGFKQMWEVHPPGELPTDHRPEGASGPRGRCVKTQSARWVLPWSLRLSGSGVGV